MPIGAMHGLTHLIDGPYRIAVADKPTRRAAVVPPVGFVVCPTAGTRFGAIRLALAFQRDPEGGKFVGEIVHLFAM